MTAGKKHILFDANPLVQNRSGVGQFSERLLIALANEVTDTQITAYYFNFLGRKKVSNLPVHKNIQYKAVRFLPSKLLSLLHHIGLQLPLEFFLSTQRYSYAIFPNFVAVPSLRNIPFSITIHDLAYLDCPEFLTPGNRDFLKRFVGRSAKHAQSIIVVSEFTKSRVAKWYGKTAAAKSIVVPIPYEPQNVVGSVSKSIQEISKKPFLLFVGTIEPRKNLSALVKAFTAAELGDEYRLVLAGGNGWKNSNIYEVIQEQNNDNIIATGYVSNAERDYLYQHCSAVCMISHYEGFGMPILEAQYYKKPVVASSIAAFKEVSNGNAIFVDPGDIQSIAAGLRKATRFKPTYAKHSFNWKTNAQHVIASMERKDA